MDIKVRDFLKSQKAEVEKNEAVVDPGALAKLEKKRAEPLQTMTAKAFTLMSAMNRHARRKYYWKNRRDEALFVADVTWDEVNSELKERMSVMGITRYLKGL